MPQLKIRSLKIPEDQFERAMTFLQAQGYKTELVQEFKNQKKVPYSQRDELLAELAAAGKLIISERGEYAEDHVIPEPELSDPENPDSELIMPPQSPDFYIVEWKEEQRTPNPQKPEEFLTDYLMKLFEKELFAFELTAAAQQVLGAFESPLQKNGA